MQLLTIIIATYNRCYMLPRVFNSILNQKVNETFDFEILLADNNSTDQTRQIVESFLPQFKNKLHYLFEPQRGKAFAVNKAIKESRGDILVFTDDDVVADESWLLNIVECFRKHNCDGLGGRILAEYPKHAPRWVKDNADILTGPIVLYDYGMNIIPFAKPMHEFLGANFAFKKSLFMEYGFVRTDIGPGRGTLGEDTELINRFLKAGKKLYYCGNAVIWHPVEQNRMNLKYIGMWNVGLGRYRFIGDEHGKIDPSLVYYFGMPRYLIVQMFRDLLSLLINIFNKRKFLIAWIDLSRKWGIITEIRKIYYKDHV
ncbi:MAG: glycosyltransferase [Candidatus Omnitrophica bacterium]|nr:glycosyltransferase [Candidatus Omnitrophota bacterium]